MALRHQRMRPRTSGGGGGGAAIPPFSGMFLDTTAGDSLSSRLNVPANAALTVNPGLISFSSASALPLDLVLKDTDGLDMWTALDCWKLEAGFTVTSFPSGVDCTGFYTGGIRSDLAGSLFGAETKSFATLTDRIYRRVRTNGSIAVSGSANYTFTAPTPVAVTVERQGNLLTTTQLVGGSQTETLSKVMDLTATSFELPRMFLKPLIRFERGSHALNSVKFSASFPNPKFGFLGDSLTQGRFATAFAEGFPQLIRADQSGQVIVAGAPGAEAADWLNASYSFLRMKPKRVFILLGTNDIGLIGVNGRTMPSIQANYSTLVGRVIASGATPVVLTVPPFNNANVSTFNIWLKAQGWQFIDLYPLLVGAGNALNATYDSGDGKHLNTAGNLLVANAVRSHITAQGW